MQTSRDKVLEYIQQHQTVSAADISLALKMTQANARHHLNILISQGLIENAGKKQMLRKGRPVQLFRVSQQALGDNLPLLAHLILSMLSQQKISVDYEVFLEQLAKQIAKTGLELSSNIPGKALKLSQRLVSAIEILNCLNYQARWEAHGHGPHIILNRCPYLKILPEHPELCRMDQFLIETITLSPAKQTARLTKHPDGRTYCLFHLNSK